MNLVINSQFRPFTYDEMVKPLVQYKEVYDKLEQDYSNLSYQTELLRNIADRENNPIAYDMFNKYSTDLAAITEDFSKGLNVSNRRALLGMKRRYSSEIEPIAKASKRRDALAEEQRKARAANPTMLYERDANKMKIDDFIKDPTLDYGRQYSGALLTSQVANAAASLAKEARDSEGGKAYLKRILPFQYEYIQKNGFSSDAVLNAISNAPNADKILTGIVDNAIQASGIADWNNPEVLEQARMYAREGLYKAIGESKSSIITDTYGMKNALARDAQRAAQAAADNNGGFQLFNPGKVSLSDDIETDFARKTVLDKNKEWHRKGYIRSDGRLTAEGIKQAKRQSYLADLEYMYNNAKTADEKMKYKRILLEQPGVTVGSNNLSSEYFFYDRSLYDALRTSGVSRDAIVSSDNKSLKGVDRFNMASADAMSGSTKYRTDIDTYTQNITSKEQSDKVLSALRTAGDATMYEVSGAGKDGIVRTSDKGIKYKDLVSTSDNPLRADRVAFVPSDPGALLITINGTMYKMTPEAVKTVLGEDTYNNIYRAASAARKAGIGAKRGIAINAAHNYMARLGQGTEYEGLHRDATEGKDTYYYTKEDLRQDLDLDEYFKNYGIEF